MKTSALAGLTALAVLLCLLCAPAHAQQLTLQIQDGLVTLEAQNVSVRQILAEWARVGGAKIINGDKVVGAPVTLQLTAVPERQAIDSILRSVSGYMLAARQPGEAGVSAFDRILILPTSAAPRAAAPSPAAGFNNRIMNRPMPTPPQTTDTAESEEDPEEDPQSDVDDEGGEEVVAPVVQPGVVNRFQRRGNVFPNPMGQPQVQPFVPQNFPQPPNVPPAPSGSTVPSNPFGVGVGSATPGVITPVPQQTDPQSPYPQTPVPTTTTRPPR